MLKKYNVSAYFCGHDHEIEHIHEPDSTVEYFLSGAGHETSSSDDNKVCRIILYLPTGENFSNRNNLRTIWKNDFVTVVVFISEL